MDEGQLLESWKAISAFLGRDLRTCQRWERELGLPIHRLDGSPKARVFAYRDELSAWLDQRLHEREGPPGQKPAPERARKALVVPGIAALSCVAAGLFIWRAIVPPKPPPLPADFIKPVLAVVPFENKSSDGSLDYWRHALAELLFTGLAQSKYVRVVSSAQMLTALRRLGLEEAAVFSSEDIARIAAVTGAANVLTGSFVKAGGKIVITADVQESGLGRSLGMVKFVAHDEFDVIPTVDKLARRIKKELLLTRAQIEYDFAREAGQTVTPFPEALKHYVEGRRHQLNNRWPDAVASMQKAIEIDPEFALAFRTLATALRDAGRPAEALAAIRKALEFAGRLPLGERELIEGQLAFWADDHAKAIEILEGLLKAHPGHLNAMTYLGYAYNGAGDLDKAIEYQRNVARDRNTVLDVRTLAGYLQKKGSYREAADLLVSHLLNIEEAWNIRQFLAYDYAYLREFGLALAEARKTSQANPQMRSAEFEMLVFMDDLAGAEALWGPRMLLLNRGLFEAHIDFARRDVEKARGKIDDEAAANRRLASALEKAGRHAEASAAFGEYLRLSAESRATAGGTGLPYRPIFKKRDLFVQARIQAGMGLTTEALKTAGELKSVIESGLNRKDLKYYEHVLGLIELAKGNPGAAVEPLASACGRLDFEDFWSDEQAAFLDPYARALRESGDLAGAREIYEKITLLTTGRRHDGDIYARAHYWLGKIAGEMGDEEAERRHTRKFLALWAGADPGLPEVADATARVNRR